MISWMREKKVISVVFMSPAHGSDRQCSKWPTWVFQFSIIFCPAAMWAAVSVVRWMPHWMLQHGYVHGLHEPYGIFVLHAVGVVVLHVSAQPNRMDLIDFHLNWWTILGDVVYSNEPSVYFHMANPKMPPVKWLCCYRRVFHGQCRKPLLRSASREKKKKKWGKFRSY